MNDDNLVELARRRAEQIGLAKADRSTSGFAVRVPKAYPDVRPDYKPSASTRSASGSTTIPNLQQVGRNGLHRYNNSDHSMLTAMRAVDNITQGHQPRPVGRERGVRLPRRARQGRAPVHRGARDRRRWPSRSPGPPSADAPPAGRRVGRRWRRLRRWPPAAPTSCPALPAATTSGTKHRQAGQGGRRAVRQGRRARGLRPPDADRAAQRLRRRGGGRAAGRAIEAGRRSTRSTTASRRRPSSRARRSRSTRST